MRKALSVVLTSVMILPLAACGSKTSGTPTATTAPAETTTAAPAETKASETEAPTEAMEESLTLNAAYVPNYGNLWSIISTIDRGYFEDADIAVNLVEFADGSTIITAMESGSTDLGSIGQGTHRLCINGQAKIFALTRISNGDAVIGDPGITGVEDLKGKKVAYSSGNSSKDVLLSALTSANMTVDDITVVDMNASGIVTAMTSGGVDACATWSSNSLKTLEEAKDSTRLCDNLIFSDKTISLGSWICMPKYAEEHRDNVLRFTKVLYRGMDYAVNDHFDETSKAVAAQVTQDYDTIYAQRGDADQLTGKEVCEGTKDGTIGKYYEIQKQNFIANGAVTVDPPVSDYVMLDIMVEVDEQEKRQCG